MPLAILCATAVGTAAGQYIFKKLDERGYDVKGAVREYADRLLGPPREKSGPLPKGYEKLPDGKDI